MASICPILLIWRTQFHRTQSDSHGQNTSKILAGLDYLGIVIIISCVVSLLLGLQLGGSIVGWSNARSIAPLVVAGVLFIAFLFVERWKGDKAMLPPRIAKLGVVYISTIYSGTLDSAYMVMVYYVSNSISIDKLTATNNPLRRASLGDKRLIRKASTLVPSNQRRLCASFWIPYSPSVSCLHHLQLFRRRIGWQNWLL